MNFLKTFLASCLGAVVGLFSVCLFLIVLVSALSSTDEVAEIADGSVLRLRLDGPITELEFEDPVAGLIPGSGSESTGLIQLTEAIRKAGKDDRIKGILLQVSDIPVGMADRKSTRLNSSHRT